MSTKEAQQRAVAKYQKKNYERKVVLVRKENLYALERYCQANGKSFSGLINELLAKEIPGYKRKGDEK